MARTSLDDLTAFLAVAREGSFTRAANRLGLSQSALSHTIRGLEERVGLRLLSRTTRSVSLTEAGERLFQTAAPRLEEIEAELAALSDLRDRPAGHIRITVGNHPAETVLWPKLEPFLLRYPDIHVEVITDNGLTDIVAERFDAGIRLGEQVAKDMIAVRISPDVCFAAVATKEYFRRHAPPKHPQDLVDHACINLRLPTFGGLYAWEFGNGGREVKVRVDGQVIVNNVFHAVRASLAGLGIAFVPENLVTPHVAKGRLRRVLEDWCPPWPGYHLYYPSRRQSSPAFALLVEALRHRERRGK